MAGARRRAGILHDAQRRREPTASGRRRSTSAVRRARPTMRPHAPPSRKPSALSAATRCRHRRYGSIRCMAPMSLPSIERLRSPDDRWRRADGSVTRGTRCRAGHSRRRLRARAVHGRGRFRHRRCACRLARLAAGVLEHTVDGDAVSTGRRRRVARPVHRRGRLSKSATTSATHSLPVTIRRCTRRSCAGSRANGRRISQRSRGGGSRAQVWPP